MATGERPPDLMGGGGNKPFYGNDPMGFSIRLEGHVKL